MGKLKKWWLDKQLMRVEKKAAKGVPHNHEAGICDFACPVWKAKDEAAVAYLAQRLEK